MNFGHVSITGKVRSQNEDSILAMISNETLEGTDESRFLGVVADGMGGGEHGEVASRIAVDTFRSISGQLILSDRCNRNEGTELMRKSYERANSEILNFANAHNIRMMGTTATSVFICGDNATIGNIGDSRTYIFDSNGSLKFVTRDHSYVQELIDSHQINGSEARTDPRRNQLTRSIGIDEQCIPDFYNVKIRRGYYILLCSDGFWDAMSDNEIGRNLTNDIAVEQLVKNMASLANEKDGSDNISLLLIIT
ncbi:MAG: PP2C family protein-serine/threonine phosphatase [Thermoplasmata archaeon]